MTDGDTQTKLLWPLVTVRFNPLFASLSEFFFNMPQQLQNNEPKTKKGDEILAQLVICSIKQRFH